MFINYFPILDNYIFKMLNEAPNGKWSDLLNLSIILFVFLVKIFVSEIELFATQF